MTDTNNKKGNDMTQVDTLRAIAIKATELADLLASAAHEWQPPLPVDEVADKPVVKRAPPNRTDEFCREQRRWTDAEKELVVLLHNRGTDHGDIARLMNRTPKAIYDRLFHRDWGLLRQPDEDTGYDVTAWPSTWVGSEPMANGEVAP